MKQIKRNKVWDNYLTNLVKMLAFGENQVNSNTTTIIPVWRISKIL